MQYEPKHTITGVVVSRLQGARGAEIMLVTSDGKSQVLALPLMQLAKMVEQGAGVLARAANELPTPPRKMDTGELLKLAAKQELEAMAPAARSEHDVMKDVCKLLKEENKDENNGGEIDSAAVRRHQAYADVANRTEAAPDSVSWRRRTAPRLAGT